MASSSPRFTSTFYYTDNVQKEGVKQIEKKLCNKGADYRQTEYTQICITNRFFSSDGEYYGS